MNKIHMKSYLGLALLTVTGFLFNQTLRAQTDILDAGFTNAGDPASGTTATLSTITVDGVYVGSSYDSVYIEDSSGYGYIYVPTATLTSDAFSPSVGATYSGLNVTTNVYQTEEEFELGGVEPASTGTSPVSYTQVTPSEVTETTPISPDYGGADNDLLFAPVEFTTGVLASNYTTGVLTTADGSLVSLYHDPTGFSLTAGDSYTLSAEVSDYNGTVELLNPVIISQSATGAPEPSTWALMGIGLAGLVAWNRRRSTVVGS